MQELLPAILFGLFPHRRGFCNTQARDSIFIVNYIARPARRARFVGGNPCKAFVRKHVGAHDIIPFAVGVFVLLEEIHHASLSRKSCESERKRKTQKYRTNDENRLLIGFYDAPFFGFLRFCFLSFFGFFVPPVFLPDIRFILIIVIIYVVDFSIKTPL